MLRGRVIAESLRADADIRTADLRLVRLGRHEVSVSTLPPHERAGGQGLHGAVSGQPSTWTFIDFEGPDRLADDLAQALADALEPDLGWWADFTVDDADRVIVFAGRYFRYRIGDEAGRAEAVAWGRAAGTPEHQLDWGR
ncbi:hypothetical protein O1Q96_26515 [Streptomyces sp. Qhu-G9]|uniref:hypothetical protein n=1 Tax=Streptomyces sp. Qhu-G9 TaxID=3452799 RepID=UPI0022AC647A|nr:hypothetical protein [Streptomyces aurantiacus]WAU82927.1 hypothetical protein O1Q96_26515 [Streptomyces aurantiacus]